MSQAAGECYLTSRQAIPLDLRNARKRAPTAAQWESVNRRVSPQSLTAFAPGEVRVRKSLAAGMYQGQSSRRRMLSRIVCGGLRRHRFELHRGSDNVCGFRGSKFCKHCQHGCFPWLVVSEPLVARCALLYCRCRWCRW